MKHIFRKLALLWNFQILYSVSKEGLHALYPEDTILDSDADSDISGYLSPWNSNAKKQQDSGIICIGLLNIQKIWTVSLNSCKNEDEIKKSEHLRSARMQNICLNCF